MGSYLGLMLAWSKGYRKVVLEVDSELVVKRARYKVGLLVSIGLVIFFSRKSWIKSPLFILCLQLFYIDISCDVCLSCHLE